MSGLNILNILQSIQDPNKNGSSTEKDLDSTSNSGSKQAERKYISSTSPQDQQDVFKAMEEVNIPILDLDLDYKPKGFEHSYSLRDAFKCKKDALSNSLLLKFMRENIPDKDFFALDASQYQDPHSRRSNNNGRNAKNKKFQGKRKGNEFQNGNAITNRRNYANNGHKNHIEDKPESSLEETFEMMKLEKEIASTGNKTQDFELFKQMMRGDIPNGNDPNADDQGPPGLSGMFATGNVDDETFQELEPEADEQSDNEFFEDPSTKKASKYASFFNEDDDNEAEEDSQPLPEESNISSRSKMLDFLRVQEEKTKSPPAEQNVNVANSAQIMNNHGFNQQQVHHHGVSPQQIKTPQGNMPPYQMMPQGQPMNYPHGNNQQHPNMNNRMQMPFNGHPQQMNPYMYGGPMGMPQHQNGTQHRQMQNMPNLQQMQVPQPGQMQNRQQNITPQHHMPNVQQMHPNFMQGMPFGNMPGGNIPNNGKPRNAQQMPMAPFMDPNFMMLPPDQQMRIMQQFQQSMNKH